MTATESSTSHAPKKALRGLFARTESTTSAPSATTSVSAASAVSPLAADTVDRYDVAAGWQKQVGQSERDRLKWQEPDYVACLSAIDHTQTGIFFIKGRLVAEVKGKFYRDNGKGWAVFCENILKMNYTTANQYIRVAQECDVMSNHRKDLGFEHFKALLPLPQTERTAILDSIPENASVKHVRDLVQRHAQKQAGDQSKKGVSTRAILATLQKLSSQLERVSYAELDQEDKWALLGAFHSLSELMQEVTSLQK